MLNGANPALSAVTGEEALAATYPEFFKWYVQRKRQELVTPNYIGIGEISLPRASLIHFFPKNTEDYGPATSEAFISNFTGDVFINFKTEFEPVIGNGRMLAMDVRKAIQAYRASHYNFNWTKDINTVYNKDNVLVVNNYGLINKMWLPRPTMFVNFERHYNQYSMLMDRINEEAAKSKERKQFFRIDLPLHMPSWSELLIDFDHYVKSFKNGLPVPSNQTVRVNKAESSYWLLDWIALLFGDWKYSLFSKLTPKAEQSLHLIFVSNSRSLIINLATLKGWLNELDDKRFLEKLAKDKTPDVGSHRESHPKRFAVTKRVYLALMNLTRNGSLSEGEVEEAKDENREEATADTQVATGAKGAGAAKGSQRETKEGRVSGKDDNATAARTTAPMLAVFDNSEEPDGGSVQGAGEEGTRDNSEAAEDWTAEVDDALLEQEKITTDTSVAKDPFPTYESGVALALEERAKEGVLTVAEQQFFMRKATQFKHIELANGQSLEEFIQVKPEEYKALKADAEIKADLPVVLDESMKRSRAKVLKQGYVDKFLHKDTVMMLLGLQNAGVAINDFKHEVVEGVEGSYDVYTIQVHPVDGDQTTHHIRMPRVGKDGTFTVDGVKSHMQLQRMELPIRKINKFKVALTSYYDRKLMVSRSLKKVDDLGAWLVKQVASRGNRSGSDITYNRGSSLSGKYDSPRVYSILASKFQWINAGGDKGVTFDFRIDKLLAEHPQFSKHTKKDDFLIGVKNDKPVTVDGYGNLYLDGVEFNTVENLLGISTAKAPTEYAVINIGGYLFPMGVVLCYYFGIDKLLQVIKATTRSVPMGNRPKLSEDEYAITFNDEYLIFNRREKLTTLIFGGMPRLNNISNFSRSNLNEKGVWVPLMGDDKVRPKQFLEMKNLFDLFIDPITKGELKKLGYSESFHYLLIDAVKLLETDWTRHEVELEEQRIVGYERFAGHMYREWVKAIRMYRNKGKGRKQKIDFNPEAVTMNIITDTSVNLVEEVNPIHQLKDQEELTFGGVGGRGEISMVKRARVQLDSYKGKISEANKDSGKVGFVTYLTSDPCIEDYRGNIAVKEKPTLTGLASVTGNLAFGMSKDDPKRGMFTSTQASQAVSAENYTPNITRTGYDSMIAHRTSELYSKVARDDGKVTEVTEDSMTVTYTDKTTDVYPLGLKIGEASGEYHRHTRVTDLKVGDKFKAGDVVGWDRQWFDRDVFCPGQVVWKAGRMIRVVMVEDQDTYEDSIAITKELAMESITPFIKKKQFLMGSKQIINWKVKIGDEVDYDSILCEVEDDHLVGGAAENSLMEDVNRLGIKQQRSNHHGKIIHIDVKYNATPEQMSDSVRKFIAHADKDRKRTASIEGSTVKSGSVSNSLNVNKPTLSPEKVLVTVYVESMDYSTTADKYVIGNQMKGTAGYIMEKPIFTLDGRKVDAKVSFKGMFNRMVLSLRDKLASNELSTQFSLKAVKVYRGIK